MGNYWAGIKSPISARRNNYGPLRQQKRVIPLLAAPGTDIPLHLETKNYLDFTGAKRHEEQTAAAYAGWLG